MTVNGDKLVIFPANRRIANFELDGYKYNSDYIKLFVNPVMTVLSGGYGSSR
jgi:hypothetical protein